MRKNWFGNFFGLKFHGPVSTYLFLILSDAAWVSFYDNRPSYMDVAILKRDEINDENPGFQGDDATVEEIMHNINYLGHRYAYPAAFGHDHDTPSLLTEAMDVARGGKFVRKQTKIQKIIYTIYLSLILEKTP